MLAIHIFLFFLFLSLAIRFLLLVIFATVSLELAAQSLNIIFAIQMQRFQIVLQKREFLPLPLANT